jgi:hypothetical protein
MNRFIKLSLLVGAMLGATSMSVCAPAQANDQQKYLDNVAVQMYANNVAHGMSPLTGGIYSPYVNGTLRPTRSRRHYNYNNNNYNYNNNNGYYDNGYGYQGYNGYTNPYAGYRKPSVWSQLINGGGY